jgi:hypothetical protein
MRTIWIAIAGILVASLLFAIYVRLTTGGNRDQTPAVANRGQNVKEPEQSNPTAESGQPPAPVAEQPAEPRATADNSPQPTEGSLPVTPVPQRRPAAGQPLTTAPHSRAARKSSAPPPEAAAASNPPQSTSDFATQAGAATTEVSTPPVQPTPAAPLPFAKLYANGKVLVNGQLSTASYICAGDWVDTSDGAEATLVGDNFELLLRSGSRLSVDQNGVLLSRGDVLVTTTSGIPVKTSSVRVTPGNTPNARFEVFDQSDGVRVMTYQGSVLVQ